MKKNSLTLLFFGLLFNAQAQTTEFFGLARKIGSPEQIYLAQINASSGVANNLSSSAIAQEVNYTGAAINPYENQYYFLAKDSLKTIDLTTGTVLYSVKINNPDKGTTFENFRFNNSDSLLYGLLVERIKDSTAVPADTTKGAYYVSLATVNPLSGFVNKISIKSIGPNIALIGNAIDPYQKLYYFATGKGIANLVALDMYTGNIYNNPSIKTTADQIFEQFTYSCKDTTIYGLLRENYYSYSTSPFDTSIIIKNLDSISIHLSKIEPSTGLITKVSPISLGNFAPNMNSSSTIDPDNDIFYFVRDNELIGVSLSSGLIIIRNTISNTMADHFELMRIAGHCEEATTPLRLASPTSINSNQVDRGLRLFPNPSKDKIYIETTSGLQDIQVLDPTGKKLYNAHGSSQKQHQIDIQEWPKGIYFVIMQGANGKQVVKFLKD